MIVMLHFAAFSTLGCIHADEGPPSRPPLALLRVIAHRVAGLDVVDLRPSTDVASCLAHTAASFRALNPSSNLTVCAEFEARARQHHAGRAANLSVVGCGSDYHRGVPDADIYLWWQRLPGWTVGGTLSLLRGFAAGGHIRASAHAIIMFDLTSWRDAGDWQHMDSQATWWTQVAFDERVACARTLPESYHQPLCHSKTTPKGVDPGRACGMWAAGAFALAPAVWPTSREQQQELVSANATAHRLHNGTSTCPFSGILACMEGHGEVHRSAPPCLPGGDGLGGPTHNDPTYN